ncbi:ABC transporter permease [Trueperella bialowiezensis]|uniref:ABC-2 family transporter protein n=1 Tax=Trueperella bialowiezensis TaxID=312285 RepID=A0A3S4VAS2_9ACTO|nr:ABC transporter permease [Trueperella bialowiezensis]VEI13406.1 ABC-2 family transporter protein [Trueperella bialowiezensis]
MTTMVTIDIKRALRDPGIFFVIGIPVLMYLIFGAAQTYGSEKIGNGNVAMAIAIGMAAYGAASATLTLSTSAAVERMQGWGRQLSLTPLTSGRFMAVKSASALLFAAITLTAIYAVAAATGSHATGMGWAVSFLVILVGSLPYALLGLAISYIFRSQVAMSVGSAFLLLFAFAGNLFVPLSGKLLEISRFTPMWGYITLARWPVTEGMWTTSEGVPYQDELWQAGLSFGVWTLVFAVLAVLALRRAGNRP